MNFTASGKKIENLTKYQELVVTNISEGEHFGLGEFSKIPNNWQITISVWMNIQPRNRKNKKKKTYCLCEICQKERIYIFYEKGQVDGEWKNL